MYQKLLNKRFFNENSVKELSAQRLVYSYMLYDGIEEIAAEMVGMSETELEEKKAIEAENNIEVLIKMMRGKISTFNQIALRRKILDLEDEIIPRIIEMLKRSLNDEFIENAVKVLVKCKTNYSAVLVELFNDIRSEYAQSLVSLVLGFKTDEDVIPFLYAKYEHFRKDCGDENYDQGPLLALVELNERFYSK
jgi:hypothetical protein